MRFMLKGTKAILTPASKEVEAMYLARPEKYIPVVKGKEKKGNEAENGTGQ